MTEAADAGYHHPLARPRFGLLEALVDGNARTHDRRGGSEVELVGDVPDIAWIREDVFGEAAIDRVAGVLLFETERLPARGAVLAMTAGGVEPRHADAIAFLDGGDAATDGDDVARALVARNERRRWLHRPVATRRVQVGMADAASLDLHHEFDRAPPRVPALPRSSVVVRTRGRPLPSSSSPFSLAPFWKQGRCIVKLEVMPDIATINRQDRYASHSTQRCDHGVDRHLGGLSGAVSRHRGPIRPHRLQDRR